VLVLLLAPAIPAQVPTKGENQPAVFSMDKDRELLVSLNGEWRFHPGDDPRWADPNFDDSQWPLIESTHGWSDQGYKNMSGLAWYRARVVIPEGGEPLGLYIPSAVTSYQVFADGRMIGQFGGTPPHDISYHHVPRTFQLPAEFYGHSHTALIAIRIWHWPVWAGYTSGGTRSGMLIGNLDLIDDYSALKTDQTEQESITGILFTVLNSLAGLTALALFAMRRREKEYLWFGTALLAGAVLGAFDVAIEIFPVSITVRDQVWEFVGVAIQLSFVGFYINLLRARRDWFFWAAIGLIAGCALFQIWVYVTWPISVATLVTLETLTSLPMAIWIDVLIIRRAIQGFPDARLVMIPQLISGLWQLALDAATTANRLGWAANSELVYDHVWQKPFPISVSDLIELLFLLAMIGILILRFTRTSRQEERLASEVEAARAVQHVLIPDEIPEVPGFAFQTVYKPASEVGGDFFQIIPASDGSVLVVIGDVSGKGMPAAMTVSLLVGTVRTLAHYTQRPGEILRAMNERMLARSQGGFTTCLVLHIDGDGTGRVANAGHLPPYIGGAELEVDFGLPLGLAADSIYLESTFQLAQGARLTLLTDGVVEARNRAGELFGFERARGIVTQSPETIASNAQAFGQQDDITVLTLSLAAAPVFQS
jgi:Stage II sporulation protein E (SpoIIE)